MPPGQAARSGDRALLTVLAGAALAYSLMQSLVIPALPAIQRSLHASPDLTSWAVTGFLLSSSVATPVAGRLGDIFGKRRVLVAVLLIVCAGTVLCTVATMPALIAGRIIQGVSGGVLPLGYAIVRDELAPHRVAHGIALLASLLGVGGGLGVIIAGLLVEHVSYTAMFWLQLPAFLIVAFCVRRYVPESPVRARATVDWTGAVLVSSGLVALLLTVTQARRWGASAPATWSGVALTATLLALWARSALRHSHPLLDLRLMRRRPIWSTNTVAFLVGVGQFAGFILLPQYVQEPARTGYGFGASPLHSGVFLLPMTVAVALAGLVVGPLERRVGARRLLNAGNVLSGLAFVRLTFARVRQYEVYIASGLLGAGVGLAMAALATITVSAVAAPDTGAAAGVNNVARTLGGAIGGQMAAALLAVGAAGGVPRSHGYSLAFGVGLAALVTALALGRVLPAPLEKPTAIMGVTVLP